MRQRASYFRNLDRSRALLLSIPFGVAALTAQNLHAVDHNVTDLATLRAAVNAVNASSTDDRILIAAGTITLTGAALDNANVSGDLDITKTMGSLEIIGASTSTTIIDGGSVDRVLHLLGSSTVTVRNLTIRNGLATDDGTTVNSALGGGILHQGGALVLENVRLFQNVARGATGTAGDDGTISAPNGTAGGPGAEAAGGALYAIGLGRTLTGCTFEANRAEGGMGGLGGAGFGSGTGVGGAGGNGGTGSDAAGGAVLSASGALVITSCTFIDNTAAGGAGGEGGIGGSSLTNAGFFGGNGGTGGQGTGGAIYFTAATPPSITDSTFDGNVAAGGDGGVGGDAVSVFGTAGGGGNGGNGAAARGGTLHVVGNGMDITTSVIRNSAAIGGSGGNGGLGGVGVQGGSGGNGGNGQRAIGGAIALDAGGLTLDRCSILDCESQGGSGGNGGNGQSSASAASGGAGGNGGFSEEARGGAIANTSSGTLVLLRSTLARNNAFGGSGGTGGNGADGSTTAGVGGLGRPGNVASGGALYQIAGTTELTSSTIANNNARGGHGGGGGAAGDAVSVGSNGGAGGGAAQSFGGGIALPGGTLDVSNSTIAGNVASGGTPGTGGAGGAGGPPGAAGANGPAAPSSHGGGVYVDSGALTLVSSIVANGVAGTGPDIFSVNVAATNSLIEDPTDAIITGTGNLNVDPQLGPLQNNGGPTLTMAIAGNSPARNTGSNPLLLATDQRGQARDDGNGVDMGAYERQPNTSSGGGKKKKDEGCSTGTGSGGWSLLAALSSLGALLWRRKRVKG